MECVTRRDIATRKCFHEIAHQKQTTFKPDPPSVVTRILAEELGGNCITSYMITLNPADDMADNLALLNMIELVRQVVNFPVRNDENFSSLRRQLRKMMKDDHERQVEIFRSQLNDNPNRKRESLYLK